MSLSPNGATGYVANNQWPGAIFPVDLLNGMTRPFITGNFANPSQVAVSPYGRHLHFGASSADSSGLQGVYTYDTIANRLSGPTAANPRCGRVWSHGVLQHSGSYTLLASCMDVYNNESLKEVDPFSWSHTTDISSRRSIKSPMADSCCGSFHCPRAGGLDPWSGMRRPPGPG